MIESGKMGVSKTGIDPVEEDSHPERLTSRTKSTME
jgi:hypothetical protein